MIALAANDTARLNNITPPELGSCSSTHNNWVSLILFGLGHERYRTA